MTELQSWIREGPRKETIEDESQFCSLEVLQSIIKSKSVFDQLEGHEMRKARTRSNPFEIIQGVFFLNRAAMKMAEMDAVFDFIFTNPRDKEGRELTSNDLLYFADVCAGPGGFSEYVLWRKGWRSKGNFPGRMFSAICKKWSKKLLWRAKRALEKMRIWIRDEKSKRREH